MEQHIYIPKYSKLFTKAFHHAWNVGDNYTFQVYKGGRSSGKSTYIAIAIILKMMFEPTNALVIRKVANTLSDSVYEQLREAIEILGVGEWWKVSKSPLGLIFLPKGNRVIFRGADNPQKLKSIKTHRYPIAILWIEELAEFKDEEEVNVIVNSVIRGELPNNMHYRIYYSYNPPQSLQSWVNVKYNNPTQPENTFVHHSTVHDNPFNSEQLLAYIDQVKAKNEMRYRWEYLGEAIGSGILPFDNITYRPITDAELSKFDTFYQGVDWGYANDPYAFVRWYYDSTRRIAYAVDEYYGLQLSNESTANWIISKGYQYDRTIADSAEPKSCDEYHQYYGIYCQPAAKGKGSVEYGEKWLRDLEEIVIDPTRTPHIAEEFRNIDYARDRFGNIQHRLEDANNHTIDATRYAFEPIMGNERRLGVQPNTPVRSSIPAPNGVYPHSTIIRPNTAKSVMSINSKRV